MSSNGQTSARKLTRDELILFGLTGKNVATGPYDTIQWRIRSGYLIVVYGSLVLFGGQEGSLTATIGSQVTAAAALGALLFVSVALCLIDLGFRLRQLRIVVARNRLTDVAFALATGKAVAGDELQLLLHIAGESSMPIPSRKRSLAVLLFFLFYLLVPMLAFVVYSTVQA